ncbi:hypothetical protein GCK72_000855 [Caenorhabditis remanei]|uniref:F-box associated domain-containing protein n=1 Tax=Caenorhabditis remanei TaxID=31234 RepID=A0A6A5HTB9_CAERE|nr:hypothetical protein GCK72_000855 [Caenorhabditis remanei]KAF1769042.1 hypothetical protein GCK72_000855 [Caenorhabditis remanei]
MGYHSSKTSVCIGMTMSNGQGQNFVNMNSQPVSDPQPTQMFKCVVSGTPLFFSVQRQFQYYFYTIAFDTTTADLIVESIHRHLNLLFFEANNEHMVTVTMSKNLICLPKLSNIKRSSISGSPVTADILEMLISKSYDQMSLIMFTSISGELKKDSKLFQVPYLTLYHTYNLTAVLLTYFNGSSGFFGRALFTNTDVIRFLKMWETGESFVKLRALVVGMDYGNQLNEVEILREFCAKPWDNTQKTRKAQWNDERINILKPEAGQIFDGWEITTKAGNKTASIEIRASSFRFLTWI